MTSEFEHTNRQRSPQQAQGRQWPILVLLLGLAALALALTACGGPSSTSTPDATSATRVPSTSTPDATSATRVPEWEETVTFSLEGEETHRIEIPVEKCEQVIYHVGASNKVGLGYRDVGDSHFTLDRSDDYSNYIATEESGILTLEVRGEFSEDKTLTDVTVSYRVAPYSVGFCFPTG